MLLGLPSMCIEPGYTTHVFSNRHGVCEDYIKYWHLRKTDLKNIDDYILPGSKKTPEPSMRVNNALF